MYAQCEAFEELRSRDDDDVMTADIEDGEKLGTLMVLKDGENWTRGLQQTDNIFDRRIISDARFRAISSAVKMLA